jgi:hypothetical protein
VDGFLASLKILIGCLPEEEYLSNHTTASASRLLELHEHYYVQNNMPITLFPKYVMDPSQYSDRSRRQDFCLARTLS